MQKGKNMTIDELAKILYALKTAFGKKGEKLFKKLAIYIILK